MKSVKGYLRKLEKARRLLDNFTVTTAKMASDLEKLGKPLDGELLVDLTLSFQRLEQDMSNVLISVRC